MADEIEKFPRVQVTLRQSWPGAEDMPLITANHFLIQIDQADGEPDLVILTVGQATPPVVLGTAEEQTEGLARLGEVRVTALGKYSLTMNRVRQLHKVLSTVIASIDDAAAKATKADSADKAGA